MSLTILQNVWWALVLIGVMIMIHELGHYWAARFFDVKVETFSFGFGPRLFGFRKGETDFRVSAIFFFGGYVKMTGEQAGEETTMEPRSLLSKPRWQRLIIMFAGPGMNMVLAVAVITGVFMVRFPKVPSTPSPVIGYVVADGAAAKAGVHEGDRIVQIGDTANPTWDDVAIKEVASAGHPLSVWILRDGQRKLVTVTPVLEPKSGAGLAGWAEQGEIEIASLAGKPAVEAGLKPGDIFVSVNGQPIRSTAKVHDIISGNGGKPVEVVYLRDGHQGQTTVTPALTDFNGTKEYMIGIRMEEKVAFVSLPLPQALNQSVRWNAKNATMIYQILRGIAERRMSPKSLAGPIGIVQMSGEAAREGPMAYFGLAAMVSLNLAVINLLPIPILDGGGILLLLVEMFMRRDLSLTVKEAVFRLGFVFLMAVLAFAIYNDISKLAS